jgi:hypothetical protein
MSGGIVAVTSFALEARIVRDWTSRISAKDTAYASPKRGALSSPSWDRASLSEDVEWVVVRYP